MVTPSSVPPYTRRVMHSTGRPCLLDACWCLRSNGMANSRLQGVETWSTRSTESNSCRLTRTLTFGSSALSTSPSPSFRRSSTRRLYGHATPILGRSLVASFFVFFFGGSGCCCLLWCSVYAMHRPRLWRCQCSRVTRVTRLIRLRGCCHCLRPPTGWHVQVYHDHLVFSVLDSVNATKLD